MTRRTATEWYIGAWIVWMGAMLGFFMAYRQVDTTTQLWFQNSNLTGLATILELSMLVMFVSWIGALVGLARQRAWGWFATLFVTQLVGAGIAGMVVYMGDGPEDEAELTRPEPT